MSRTKKTTRVISILISLAMLMSVLVMPTVSYAALTPDQSTSYSNKRADISYAYMGKTAGFNLGTDITKIPDENIDDFTWTPNSYVWVGVYVEHMTRITDMFKDEGLKSLSLSIQYDSDYFEWDQSNLNVPFSLIDGTYGTAIGEPSYPYTTSSSMFGTTYTAHYQTSGYDPTSLSTYNGDTTLYPTALTNADKSKIMIAQQDIKIKPAYATADKMFKGDYIKDDKKLIAIFPLKMKANAPTAGTKILEGTFSVSFFALTTGEDGYRFSNTRSEDADTNLNNYFNIVENVIDLAPTSSTRALQSIELTNNSYVLPDQYETKPLDTTGLALTGNYNEAPTTESINMSKVTFMYAEANDITDPESQDLTEVPDTLTSDMDDMWLYAVYTEKGVTKMVRVRQLNVIEKGIAKIDIRNTTDFAKGTYYTNTKVTKALTAETDPETLEVTVTYNTSATDKDNITYDKFGTKLALAKLDGDNKLVKVTDDDYYAAGVNTFYVVRTSDLGKALADVDANCKPSITSSSVTKNDYILVSYDDGAKLKYAAADKIVIPGEMTINAYKPAEGDATSAAPVTVTNLGGGVKFYYGDANNSAYDAAKVITSGSTPYADAKDKYLLAIAWDTTTGEPANGATPVLIGQLTDRAIVVPEGTTQDPYYTAQGITTDQNTVYGTKLGDGAQIKVNYDNGDKNIVIPYEGATADDIDFDSEGISMQIVDKDGNEIVASADKDTVLTPEMNGGSVIFYSGTGANKKKIGEIKNLQVKHKPVKVKATSPTAPSKTYDGGKTVEADDKAALNVAIDTTDIIDADSGLRTKIKLDGLDYEYDNKNVGTTKKIKVTGTPVAAADTDNSGAATDVTDFNKKYKLELATGFADSGSDKILDGVNGIITAKTLNIATIENVPHVAAGSTGQDLVKSNATARLNTNTNTKQFTVTDGSYVDKDDVEITYTATYPNTDTDNPTVTISAVSITGGNDKANYTLGTTPGTATGTVDAKTPKNLLISGPTKTVYTYGESTVPDLTGLSFKIKYDDNSEAPVALDDVILTVKGSAFDKAAALPVGETKVDATAAGVPADGAASFTLTVNPKPIDIDEIVFSPSKIFNTADSTATKAYGWPDGFTFVGEDGTKVKLTYDVTFTDSDAGTKNRKATISNIKLAPVEDGDKTYNNYVIAQKNQDGTYTAIADNYTKNLTDATISQGTKEAPAAPELTVSTSTNKIQISKPLGDDLEYSIDGTNYMSKADFDKLTFDQGKEYTVYARYKESDDHNIAASPASSAKITTYKYHVRAFRKNADIATATPVAEIYTNTDSADNDNDMNTKVFTSRPSRWKAYYTDAPATVSIVYPYAIKADTVLYMTQSSGGSGGGGGGVSTYTVKFNAGEYGVISSGKASVSVASGNKVETSSLPTVTPKTGYRFVGWSTDGTTVIDPTSTTVSKGVTYTALYEEIVDETPTPAPTEAPVIDENYTKPYASGYEDGSFRPDGQITRAELAAMIARLSYGDDLPDDVYYSSFDDVADDAWYAKYVGYLEDKDVLSGYEDGTFRPQNPVTRGEISAVITRAQRLGLDTYTGQFTDVTDDDWARDYIQTLADNGIASGYEDGTFGPYNPLTRAEAVTMINKVLAPSEPVVSFTPNDVLGHWAYDQILLAVNERRLTGEEPASYEEDLDEPEEIVEGEEEDGEVTEVIDESDDEVTDDSEESDGEVTDVAEDDGEVTDVTE